MERSPDGRFSAMVIIVTVIIIIVITIIIIILSYSFTYYYFFYLARSLYVSTMLYLMSSLYHA